MRCPFPIHKYILRRPYESSLSQQKFKRRMNLLITHPHIFLYTFFSFIISLVSILFNSSSFVAIVPKKKIYLRTASVAVLFAFFECYKNFKFVSILKKIKKFKIISSESVDKSSHKREIQEKKCKLIYGKIKELKNFLILNCNFLLLQSKKVKKKRILK